MKSKFFKSPIWAISKGSIDILIDSLAKHRFLRFCYSAVITINYLGIFIHCIFIVNRNLLFHFVLRFDLKHRFIFISAERDAISVVFVVNFMFRFHFQTNLWNWIKIWKACMQPNKGVKLVLNDAYFYCIKWKKRKHFVLLFRALKTLDIKKTIYIHVYFNWRLFYSIYMNDFDDISI